VTSGGFSEYEASRNRSEPSSRSHCQFNTRTVVISVLLGPLIAVTYRFSQSPCCFSVSRSLVFEGTFPLNFALRMVNYPHNPQSHQLAHSTIVPRPRASGPATGPLHFPCVFSLARSLFPLLPVSLVRFGSRPPLLIFSHILVSLCAFPHVCFAKLGRVNNLF